MVAGDGEMPARVISSRMPAGGWQYGASKRGESSRVPARERRVAVTEQRDETERRRRWREGGRIANTLAKTDKQAIARAFGTTTRPWRDRDVTNRSFPHQRYKPSKPRPTSTESPDAVTPTVNEARSFPTVQNPKRGAKEVRGKGERRTS